ncbi:MAG TPA: AAA family ATPase, partial [Thermoanaerobaculia bacterium]
EQWNAAVDRVLARMGLAEHQALVVAHGDTDREHVHIVVNRVHEDGRAWETRQDMVKAYAAVHEIEAAYGVRRTGEPAVSLPNLSSGAHQEARRKGEEPLADRVRGEAGADLARAASWRELDEQLAARGFRLESASRGSGVVVSDGTRRVSLSHVERELSGPKLAARFGETFRDYREREPEPPTIQAPPGKAAGQPLPGERLAERAAALLDRITETRATFTESDLKRAAFYQRDSAALVREALKPEHALELGREQGGANRYTSLRYLEAEAGLFSAADRLAGRGELRLDPAAVARTVGRSGSHLSDEQRAAVFHATTQADLAQIIGRAGAGKTTVARTIAEAYREQGYEVHGAALAGKAAEGLEREAGIPSRTLASLERAWGAGKDHLHGGSVLVVDEAGMIDTAQLGRVLREADHHDAKVVLIGDPDQLKAIGAGDAYRGLLERHESRQLETIRRQTEPWQRSASAHLAGGRTSSAIDAYEEAGRLRWTDTRAEARSDLAARYLEDRRQQPERSQLILAYRNEDARQLNEVIRSERRAAGELGPGVSAGGVEYAAGDRIVFLKNDHTGRDIANLDASAAALGVKNGTLGTVEKTELRRFSVQLDDGRRVAFDPESYGAIAHGYAVTVHKSQGATVDRAYVLADPLMDRNATYVALTRHREAVQLYADRETFRDREGLDKALSRTSRKDLAYDYAAADLSRLAGRVEALTEKTMALRREEQSLKADLVTLSRVEIARKDLDQARTSVEKAAGRIYLNPPEATRALLADPRAVDRLAAGEAEAYGRLRGHTRLLLGKDTQRSEAERQIPGLRGALANHRESSHRFTHQQSLAGRIGGGVVELQAQLQRVVSAVRMAEAASRGPEEALTIAVRQTSRIAVQAVVSLLPPPIQAPVRLALRAAERVLGLVQELGR